MIWFNIKSLEEKLIQNKVSEETGFHYLLTFLIFLMLAIGQNTDDDFSNKWWRYGDFLIGLFIMIWGISKTFKINSKGNNKDFLKRYFSLSFVHSFRLAIVLVIILLLKKLLIEYAPVNISSLLIALTKSDLVEFSVNLLISVLYYFLLIKSFMLVNKNHHINIASVKA
jgi:hypothetical protein